MNKALIGIILVFGLFVGVAAQAPAVDVPISVSDGAGGIQELRFGLAPSATDGIDVSFGEEELPPTPPSGVFDARFIGDEISIGMGQGQIKDYRQGSSTTTGTRVHELRYQVGSGTSITITWNLPSGVIGRLQDILTGTLIDVAMNGSGSYTVTNPGGFNKLKMTITYTMAGAGPAVDVPITVSDGSGGVQELRFGLDSSATDGIDVSFGEEELPPIPPSGVFDARFIGDEISIGIGQGQIKDYRQGSSTTNGTRVHELRYQVGSGTSITITWNLPSGVTGRLQDILTGTLIDVAMNGSGSYTIANPGGFNKLKMTITYALNVQPEPVADFTGTPTSGNKPLNVQFTNQSTGSITSYSWNFGDSGTSTVASPSHSYANAGTYTVALTVTGPGGSNTRTRTNYITVTEPTPVISVTLPNGSENWQAGSSHNITWTSSGTSGNVKIEYSYDNGSNWHTIIGSTPDNGNGSYPWTVPNTPSTQCLVKITDTDGSPSDQSDGVFTISTTGQVIATVGCGDYFEGSRVIVPIDINMSGVASPNEKLGSYTGTLDWNKDLLRYVSHTGGTTGGWSNPTINASGTSTGHLGFTHANTSGTTGTVNIINVTFDVIGSTGQSGIVDLGFSAMAAAGTFVNLTPFLNIQDCNYTIYPAGILGDVNGDGNVNSTDALIILSCDVGINVSQFCPMNCGDVNGDGLVNSTDALIILSYDVGISVPFPVGQPGCPQNVTPCPGCN